MYVSSRSAYSDVSRVPMSIAAPTWTYESAGLNPGDRCILLGANSIRWAALDLAIMAEGLVRVPMYTRQAPVEVLRHLTLQVRAKLFDLFSWADGQYVYYQGMRPKFEPS